VVVSSNDTKPNIPVLGPEEPAINRIRNEYIRTIIIKIPINTSIVVLKIGFKKC
jgi:primosomal protein N' (replication factor Y)